MAYELPKISVFYRKQWTEVKIMWLYLLSLFNRLQFNSIKSGGNTASCSSWNSIKLWEMSNNILTTVLFRILIFILGNVKHAKGSEEKLACGYAPILWLNSCSYLSLNVVTSYNWVYQLRVLFFIFHVYDVSILPFFCTVIPEVFKLSCVIKSSLLKDNKNVDY